jgi:hypothetical protein
MQRREFLKSSGAAVGAFVLRSGSPKAVPSGTASPLHRESAPDVDPGSHRLLKRSSKLACQSLFLLHVKKVINSGIG